MKIVSLVDNVTGTCPGEHGLSLWIELESGKRILFDMGQGCLFADNAAMLGLALEDIDIAVVSHGHYDHCGGLGVFVEKNSSAKIYMRPGTLESHYSLKEYGLKDIGAGTTARSERFIFAGDIEMISDELILFSSQCEKYPMPGGNSTLFGSDGVTPDDFSHEQNLIVRENGKIYVFAGCAHRGAANILSDAVRIAGGNASFFIGGMHLMRGTDDAGLDSLAGTLCGCGDCRYLTMHCTGEECFLRLKDKMGDRIEYLKCGTSVSL